MKNPLWPAIHDIFQDIEQLVIRSGGVVEVQKKKTAASGVKVFKRGIQVEDVVQIRANIRTKLDFLKARLGEHLNEREVYLVLFPLVVYFDEIVHSRLPQGKHMNWPPLQKELFKISNGGEMFYITLDDILRKPETLPFIYEVFYFCLRDGFKGRYAEDAIKISEYEAKLKDKIPVTVVTEHIKEEKAPNLMKARKMPIIGLYVASAAIIVISYIAFYLLASM